MIDVNNLNLGNTVYHYFVATEVDAPLPEIKKYKVITISESFIEVTTFEDSFIKERFENFEFSTLFHDKESINEYVWNDIKKRLKYHLEKVEELKQKLETLNAE